MLSRVAASLLLLAPAARAGEPLRPDPPKACDACDEWNEPAEPFRVFGNTYYVGVAGLSAILVTSSEGHVLLDGGLPQSAPRIDSAIRKLGFRAEDVRLILNSHAHYDHAGGIAALQRASGAIVAASPSGAAALERGQPPADDPQSGFGPEANGFPAAKRVRSVADGETLRVGPLAVTAHWTPGHTPGSTTWTWRSCEAERCLDVVYADSVTPVSAPGFRFTGDAAHAGTEAAFRRSLATIAALPCDILLAPHPGFVGLDERRKRREAGADALADREACRAYAAGGTRRLDERVAEEKR